MSSKPSLPPAKEYTILPARLNGGGEIVPGYPGQAGAIGWTAFTRSHLGYQHAGEPVFRSERAAIDHLWNAHRFIVRLDSNPAESCRDPEVL